MKYKLTVAAVIIIGVFICVKQFGGSIDGASVAWADVVEQVNNYTKYKNRQRVVRQQGPEYPTMQVYHLNNSQRRQEVENGNIHIIDMRGVDAITVELFPDEKRAVVTKLIGFGPKEDPEIINIVKRFEEKSTEKLGTKTQKGKVLYGFRHRPNEHSEFTVWVDTKTKLPVEIEIKHLKRGQTIYLDEFEYDFDLDPSAFSTDIPEGYTVKTIIHDYRPVEPKEITTEDVQSKLNHTAYTVKKLPWMKQIIMIEDTSPLGGRDYVYMTAIPCNDGNMIILVQGNYYDMSRMVWIPKQQLVLETHNGTRLYEHPNGSIYAKLFLESIVKAKPDIFDYNNLSEERFTRMIVMPDGIVLGMLANKYMSNKELRELVDSIIEIKAK